MPSLPITYRFAFATALIAGMAMSASAAKAEVSFKDKRVQLIVASNAGGGTDRVGRLVAQYLEKYLPGKPNIVVKNMGSGGGKIRAANYLMNKAKPDGYTFMQSDGTVVQPSTLRRRSARYDPRKFEYIGSLNRGGSVLFVRKDALKRLKDKSKRPVIVGAISGTRSWQALPMWGAEFLGWNVRWIPGYKGSGSMIKAIRQGEIDMFATNNVYIIDELLKDGVTSLVAQDGQTADGKLLPRPSYKQVPVMLDLLKSAKISKLSKQGYRSMAAPSEIDKWMGLPPGTPKAYVKAYRAAYKKVVNDPTFLKIARKQFSKEINYIDGPTVSAMVNEIFNAPGAAVDYAEGLKKKYGLAAFKKKRKKKKKKKTSY